MVEEHPDATGPLGSVSDEELVRRSVQRDLAAYDELVRRYQGKIYGLVYNMTANKEDAEDVVQDVFLKAYRSLPRFKGQSSFYTWVYRIAINRTINFRKKRTRRAALSLDDADEGIERDPAYVELSSRVSPVREVSIGELQERLNKALLTLSEKHRTVVVLHDIQGVPHEEIAKMVGCSAGTVRSRLFYARQKLQVELKDFAP
ncbi:MAG: sigma-70 family RNA polymerase sigma factor [Kiritimatiellae bacterium]|nr:sigma-70 family RNA polymerase sigma factor [Kiritimatiellia bacterium]